MAGFQKFPVPRALYYDAWAYNKKWMGNGASAFVGAFFVALSLYRYTITRSVNSYLFRILLQDMELISIQATSMLLSQLNSEV